MAAMTLHWRGFARALVRGETVSGMFALAATLALGVLLAMAPQRAAVQRDNSAWRAWARAFLDTPQTARTDTVPADIEAYALAYASTGQRAALQQDLQIMASLETFTRRHVRSAEEQGKSLNCLAEAIYYEARNEPEAGQLAVAQVVLNRVRHRAYPSSICAVVFEGASRRTGCQFTFTCDGAMAAPPHGRSWRQARLSAIHAMLGMSDVTIGRATHYHTVSVDPRWSANLLRTANIGRHVFYRFPSRREKALLGSAA